jgi:hypothetical protein
MARKAKRGSLEMVPANNLVVVSDTHFGCGVAICPPEGARLDDGGTYKPSKLQQKIWGWWAEFWEEFVPESTRGEPYAVVHNGDAIDGVHHQSTTQFTQNLEDQSELGYQVLKSVVELCEGRYYHIRGTEAHVGKSAREEERLAKRLGAVPNQDGQHARYDLWIQVGEKIVHLLHHVGTTSSQAYESTALHKEFTESLLEAARWGYAPPSAIVRSHRHRSFETGCGAKGGRAFAAVTAGWQGKTPFAWKIAGARLAVPQFGGIVIRYAHGRLFCDHKVWTVDPSPLEVAYVKNNHR